MSEHKLTGQSRFQRLRLWLQQMLRRQKAATHHKFTPMPRKARLSKRGEQHPSWYTKRWTRSRLKDLPKSMRRGR